MDKLFYAAPLMALLGLLYTFIKSNWVAKQDAGTNRMQEISKHIAEGAIYRRPWLFLLPVVL
jgi:K(+)-stimulated pyrophosphate-energized sodium pump